LDSFVETIIFTWNHEAFVDAAIASWEDQELDESSSLVVNDDASTDATLSQVLSRIGNTRRPITVISRIRNQYRESRFLFVLDLYGTSKAKYVAVLDGDDFWCSKDKLRLTTGALEAHPEACLVFHDFFVPVRSIPLISIRNPSRQGAKKISLASLVSENPIGALTAVFRTNALPESIPEGFARLKIADLPIWCFLANRGDVIHLPKSMAVYRMHAHNYFANLDKVSQHQAHKQAIEYILENLPVPAAPLLPGRRLGKWSDRFMRLRLTPRLWLRTIRI